tara:strand:- start:5646 stop:5864 length:219 start_codon:yes stop_codon:yes gene_type:complete
MTKIVTNIDINALNSGINQSVDDDIGDEIVRLGRGSKRIDSPSVLWRRSQSVTAPLRSITLVPTLKGEFYGY